MPSFYTFLRVFVTFHKLQTCIAATRLKQSFGGIDGDDSSALTRDQRARIKYRQESGERQGQWRDARGRFCLLPGEGDIVISSAQARELSAARREARDGGSNFDAFDDRELLRIRTRDVADARAAVSHAAQHTVANAIRTGMEQMNAYATQNESKAQQDGDATRDARHPACERVGPARPARVPDVLDSGRSGTRTGVHI